MFNLEIKSLQEEGVFEGYASIFNVTDYHNDCILKGAFDGHLKDSKQHPQMLWQHDPCMPIGKWLDIRETEEGLYVKGQLLLELAKAREIYVLIQQNIICGLSVGFLPKKSYKKDGVRYLEEIKLFEISLVTFPANPLAQVIAVKNEKDELYIQKYIDRLTEFIRGNLMQSALLA